MGSRYPAEFRERALRLLAETRPDQPSEWAALEHVAGRLGMTAETLRKWSRQGQVTSVSGREHRRMWRRRLKRLRKKIIELEKANQILREASVFFAAELGRPSSR